jgi:hypothetical protein
VSAEKDLAAYLLSHRRDRIPQARAIAFGIAGKRRSGSPLLTVWQVAAQDDRAVSTEGFGKSNQQRSIAVAASSMREDQRIAAWDVGSVHPPAYCRLKRGVEK